MFSHVLQNTWDRNEIPKKQ